MILIVLLALSGAHPNPYMDVPCDSDPRYQTECEEFHRADGKLNAAYSALFNLARNARTKDERHAEIFESLVAAQRAWIMYRDNDCRYYEVEIEGQLRAPLVYQCLTEHTRARTARLRALANMF